MPNIPSKLNTEITDTYFVKDNTFFAVEKYNPMDLVEKEIGDSKVFGEFLPQQKICRWDNEVNFSARLVHDELTPTVSTLEDKIVWDGEKVAVNFYDLPIDEANPEGASEFEVILKEKPKTNIVSFTLNTKGLDFFYQPELTQEEKDNGGFQPDNVIGSYAVYASENKINYVGGKEYKCGKVGHIFRPRIEDTDGNWVWGELNVDTENGILSVTIPQDFLDKAVYPVRHAAGLTFGYTTAGGILTSNIYSGWPTWQYSNSSVSSTIDSVSVHGSSSNASTINVKSLVLDSSYNFITNGISPAVTYPVSGSADWKIHTYTSKPSVTETTYGLGVIGSSGGKWSNDNSSGKKDYIHIGGSYASPEAGSASENINDKIFSIYATYTAAATGYSSPFPSFKQI